MYNLVKEWKVISWKKAGITLSKKVFTEEMRLELRLKQLILKIWNKSAPDRKARVY